MRFIILVSFLVLISGCTFIEGLISDDKKEEKKISALLDIEEEVFLDSAWSSGVGGQGDEDMVLQLTPALDGDMIYAANAGGDVVSINAANGDENWDVSLDANITSAVGAGNGLVVVGTNDGQVIVIDQQSGAEKWRNYVSSEVLGAPATDGRVVIVQSIDSKVQAFDATTGTPRWTYASSNPVLTFRGTSAPVIDGEFTFMTFDSGKIAAVGTDTGIVQWEQQGVIPAGRSELNRVIDTEGKPLVAGMNVFFATYQGKLVALEKTQGKFRWREDVSTLNTIVSGNTNIYVVDDQDSVRAISQASGSEQWRNTQLQGRQLRDPVVLGDYVIVPDAEGYLHILTQDDGRYVGRYSSGNDVMRNAPIAGDNAIYILSNNGKLHSLRVRH